MVVSRIDHFGADFRLEDARRPLRTAAAD